MQLRMTEQWGKTSLEKNTFKIVQVKKETEVKVTPETCPLRPPNCFSTHGLSLFMLSVTVNVRKDWNLTGRGAITRSRLCCASQEMENAWNEYSRLERDVDWLKSALQGQMSRGDLSQVRGCVIWPEWTRAGVSGSFL